MRYWLNFLYRVECRFDISRPHAHKTESKIFPYLNFDIASLGKSLRTLLQ